VKDPKNIARVLLLKGDGALFFKIAYRIMVDEFYEKRDKGPQRYGRCPKDIQKERKLWLMKESKNLRIIW
jgi:serine/threonine-protein kinase RIO1